MDRETVKLFLAMVALSWLVLFPILWLLFYSMLMITE